MKKMKKLLCMILALMFVLSLATTALADDSKTTDSGTDTATAPVTATATKEDAVPDTATAVYSVTIAWQVKGGTIKVGKDSYTWDPSTRQYSTKVENSNYSVLTDAEITVTVTNNSNKAIDVTLAASDDAKFSFAAGLDLDKPVASAAEGINNLTGTGTEKSVVFSSYVLELDETGIVFNTNEPFSIGSVNISIAPAA